jgi:hypothetical protein
MLEASQRHQISEIYSERRMLMKTSVNITTPERRTLLSFLWIFLSVNYILCDVYTNMETAVLQQLIRGQVAGMEVT